jgi:uncharacterized damage-inducible protein DinB
MSEVSTYLGGLFQFQTRFALAGFDGFTTLIWSQPAREGTNHPIWILAHLTAVRRALARNLGLDVAEERWESHVAFGEPALPADEYPSPEALGEAFQRLGQEIARRLESADSETLSAAYRPTFPDGQERSVESALGLLLSHEAVHIGQISLIRRLHGLPGIANVLLADVHEVR